MTTKKELSEKQKSVLNFICKEQKEKGYPPSVREICTAVGLKSTSTVHSYLQKLEKQGFVVKDPSKPRALKILCDNTNPEFDYAVGTNEIINVPIIGKVTAGQPILATENIEGTFPIPIHMVKNQPVFMLKVKGDSMIDAGIFDKDFILVNKQPTAQNGDIVVALIGDEATVKTYFKKADHFVLRPENKHYEPIVVKDGLSILGKVIGLFRKF